MDEDKLLKLTPEECFLLLTGARLFDRLVAGVTIHAEQKDELIREIIAKLSDLVPEQLESMSDELADAIVESVLGCEDIEDTELEELELAFLDTDIDAAQSIENAFFSDNTVKQLSIDGLDLEEDEIQATTREFIQNESGWPPFEMNSVDESIESFGESFGESLNKPRKGRISETSRTYSTRFPGAPGSDGELIPPKNSKMNEQLEKFLLEETFSYPMYAVEDKLPILEKALLKHRSIEVHYYSVARETVDQVKLDPLVILQEDGMWLLVAYCHERDDVLIFRADRMKEIAETELKFETPQDINELRCRMLAAYK